MIILELLGLCHLPGSSIYLYSSTPIWSVIKLHGMWDRNIKDKVLQKYANAE